LVLRDGQTAWQSSSAVKIVACWVMCCLVVAGCSEDDPFRHLGDGSVVVDTPSVVELEVTKAGNGDGTITSSPTGISCGATCTGTFTQNATVTLTATPAEGSMFTGWSGACSGDATTCDVTLAAAASVTATFTLVKHTVTVTKAGPGTGMVMGPGMSCDATCTFEVDHGSTISLTPTPTGLSVFAGWGGACTGTANCELTVTSDVSVTASFALDNFSLITVPSGNGTGTITSNPTGINCGSDCDQTFTANQTVVLTATPATGSSFTGWSGGGCTGTGTCTVTITGVQTVTAEFTLNKYALTVTPAGNGQGKVTGTDIDCGTDCTESYDYNTSVTLMAAPAVGSTFTGWSGACTGTGNCIVKIDQAKDVTATFTLTKHQLTVATVGNGSVTGPNIDCGTDCTELYNYSSMITLTAAPATGYSFMGWSGACSGTGACMVTMTTARSVTATFTINKYLLTITPPTNGKITGTNIDCGTDCSESFDYNTNVTLTPTPATGYSFNGWTGACAGTGPCAVTMTAAKTVGATFTINKYLLTVTPSANGTVAGMGITCGNDCAELISHGTDVTLTAMPATGYTFTGWSSTTGVSCPGTGTCTVSMIQAQTVTANYSLKSYALTVTPPSNGAVTGPNITCGTDCTETFTHGTNVTLTAVPATGYAFKGWSSTTGVSCPGTGTCIVPMTQAQTVSATFEIKSYVLTVTPPSNGSVAGMGITCGTDCSESFTHGTNVTLTAMPATGYSFKSWSSTTGVSCPGTGTCTVPMTQAQTVTATFEINSYLLTVTPPTNGTVTGAGITCGTDCSESITHGTPVTLTATPAPGYSFDGWSSTTGVSCPGTGTCTLSMTQAQTVSAAFKINNYTLTVAPPSNGTVKGSGITCGADCTEPFPYLTNVVLTATPNTNYIFVGWSSTTGVSCLGTGTCTVPMTQAQTVSASFQAEEHKVVVSITGGGKGAVEGPGITCPNDCTESGLVGAQLTLVAKPENVDPAKTSVFTGWSGACTGFGPCVITIGHANVPVTANFELAPNLMFVTNDIFNGQLDGLAGADKKCQTAAAQAGLPGNYVAYLSALEGNTVTNAPSRVGGARGWTRVDGKYFLRKIEELHSGQAISTPDISEYGTSIVNAQTQLAWTGTTSQGTFVNQCLPQGGTVPWTGTANLATLGYAMVTSSEVVQATSTRCAAAAHLYCFGIDRAADLQ
jgi:uncharacterized repeat protein (TIGR02543 family)